MTFPIIQQPSPLQQLSSLIQNLRQQAMERRMQEEEIVRRQQYLQLAQQEAAGNAAYRADQTRRADRTFEYGLERDKVSDAANAEAASLARRRQHETETGNLLERGRQALPPGYTATPQALLDIAKGRNDLSSLPQGRPGLQGSATRAPTPATAGGITHTPGVLSYNAPSGGGAGAGRGPNAVQERHAIGQSLLRRVINEASALETRNPSAGQMPFAQDLGAAIAERGLGTHAGGRIANRIRSFGSDADQRRYHQLREQFKHSMAVFYPRAAITIFENLADSYFGVGGETDDDLAAKRADREFVGNVIDAVRAGQLDRTSLDALLTARGAPPNLAEYAGEALPADAGFNSAGQPVGVPMAPGASRSASALDSYLGRVRAPQ